MLLLFHILPIWDFTFRWINSLLYSILSKALVLWFIFSSVDQVKGGNSDTNETTHTDTLLFLQLDCHQLNTQRKHKKMSYSIDTSITIELIVNEPRALFIKPGRAEQCYFKHNLVKQSHSSRIPLQLRCNGLFTLMATTMQHLSCAICLLMW